jgi:hypothetical protein
MYFLLVLFFLEEKKVSLFVVYYFLRLSLSHIYVPLQQASWTEKALEALECAQTLELGQDGGCFRPPTFGWSPQAT